VYNSHQSAGLSVAITLFYDHWSANVCFFFGRGFE